MSNRAENVIREMELLLANNEIFGDWSLITGRMLARYRLAIRLQAGRQPIVNAFLDALDRADVEQQGVVMTDPLVRAFLNHLCGDFSLISRDVATDGLAAVIPFLSSEKPVSPLESEVRRIPRIKTMPRQPWIWQNYSEGIFSCSFRQLFERRVDRRANRNRLVLRKPTEQIEQQVAAGIRMLSDLLPDLTDSALSHAQGIAMIDTSAKNQEENISTGTPGNVSFSQIAGIMFLSPPLIVTPWQAAESIFHEALHHKLYDLLIARSILQSNSTGVVQIPWRQNAKWNIKRALAAFHVYVHLCLFGISLNVRADELVKRYQLPSKVNPVKQIQKNGFQRANYLGQELKRVAEQDLGPDGRLFVKWLLDGLDTLAACCP